MRKKNKRQKELESNTTTHTRTFTHSMRADSDRSYPLRFQSPKDTTTNKLTRTHYHHSAATQQPPHNIQTTQTHVNQTTTNNTTSTQPHSPFTPSLHPAPSYAYSDCTAHSPHSHHSTPPPHPHHRSPHPPYSSASSPPSSGNAGSAILFILHECIVRAIAIPNTTIPKKTLINISINTNIRAAVCTGATSPKPNVLITTKENHNISPNVLKYILIGLIEARWVEVEAIYSYE